MNFRTVRKNVQLASAGPPGGSSPKKVMLWIMDLEAYARSKAPTALNNAVRTPVSGVGDEAFYLTLKRAGASLR